MDSIKNALHKGLEKATSGNNEPQVLSKSSQSHALNIIPNTNDRPPSLTHTGGGVNQQGQDPSRSLGLGAGAVGGTTATGTNPAARQ